MKVTTLRGLGTLTGFLILVQFLGLAPLKAQQYFGTVVGTVTDASGAAVPHATITITNTQTGIARQVATDQYGNYTVSSLVPATYSIKAEVQGFERTEVSSVDVPVARTVTVNLTMKLGTVTQTVEVQATAPLLDTSNATVGT